jgi:hypothetical protein
MGHKLHCMMCGREKFDPEANPEREFYLCWDCAKFWFADLSQAAQGALLRVASVEPPVTDFLTRRRARRKERN